MNATAKRWVARLLTRMEPEPTTDCVRWTGSLNKVNGYGQVRVSPYFDGLVDGMKRPRFTGIHRVIFALVRGRIPSGFHIDHCCSEVSDAPEDNRWCVNPYHLQAMPPIENAWLANRRRWHDDRAPAPEDYMYSPEPIL